MQTVRVNSRSILPSSYRARANVRARTRIAPHASLQDAADWLAKGFLKIFTPPTDSGVNWTGTSAGYPGDVTRRGSSKFPKPVGKQQTSTEQVVGEAIEVESNKESSTPEIAEYMAGALQRVMGHNFKGDSTEPDWKSTGTGWSGEIGDRRKSDGFHSKKL